MVEKTGGTQSLCNNIALIGRDFYPICELIIDQIALISKTAIKNKEIGCGEEA